jgi:O-antigen/teichoic acid export membrane protein
MSLTGRAVKGFYWTQSGALAQVGLSFLLSLLLARYLGPSAYGVLAFGLSLISVCCLLALAGTSQETVGKFVPEAAAGRYSGGFREFVLHLLGVRVLGIVALGLILFAFSSPLERAAGMPRFGKYLVPVLILFSLRSISDLFSSVFSGLLEMGVVAAAKALVPLAALILLVGAIWSVHRISLREAFVALAGGQFLGLLTLLAASGKLRRSGEAGSSVAFGLRRVLMFGLFAWLAGFFIYVMNEQSDLLVLSFLLRDPEQVGWYAVGSSLVFRPLTVLLAGVTLCGIPILSEAYLRSGKEGLARVVTVLLKVIGTLLVPPMILLISFARELVVLLYSESYLQSVPVVRVLAILLGASGLLGYGVYAGALYALNRERMACAIFGISAAFGLLSSVALVKVFGMMGAAWATGLTVVLFSILSAVIGSAAAPAAWPWRFHGKILLASLLAAASAASLRPETMVKFTLGAALWLSVFIFCLSLLKPLECGEAEVFAEVSPRLGHLLQRFFAGPDTPEFPTVSTGESR